MYYPIVVWILSLVIPAGIGSTLEVQPAASVPLVAARNGAPYVILNRGETAHDGVATHRLEGDAVEILPRILEQSQ